MVRLKHRYVVGQVLLLRGSPDTRTGESEDRIHPRDIVAATREKLALLYGDVGGGQFGSTLAIKYLDNKSLIFVVRCSRGGEMQSRFAMTAVESIKGIQLSIRTLACCGSVRTTRDKLEELLYIADGSRDSEDQRSQIKIELSNVEL